MGEFKSPAYQLYPKDILGSARVAEMPIEIEGYYRRALDYAWLSDGLPNDPDRVAAILGKGCTREAAERVLQMFELDKKDSSKVRNPRQEIERKKQRENSKKRKEAGRLSGVKRREKRDLEREQTLEQNANKTEPSYSNSESLISIPDFKRLIKSAVAEFPKTDKRLIEIGVLYTLLQRNGSTNERIRSSRYFHPQIKKIVEEAKGLTDNTITVLLARRREQYFGEQSGG